MITAIGTARVRHAQTGKVYELDAAGFEFTPSASEARGMGPETTHEAIINHPQLGELRLTVWEYPVGVENHRDFDVGPHTLVEDIEVELRSNDLWEPDAQTKQPSEERQQRIDDMVAWFALRFEDPAVRTPYESREGGYLYIHGGPYDASEVLAEAFPHEDQDLVDAAVDEIQADGIFDWVPTDDDEFDVDTPEEVHAPAFAKALQTLVNALPAVQSDPAFVVGDDGLVHLASPPDSRAVDDEDDLLQELRASTAELLSALSGTNAHTDFLALVERYSTALAAKNVSISALYSRGVRLSNAAVAIERRAQEGELPLLSDNIALNLASTMDLHGAYIMRHREGRALVEAAAAFRRSVDETDQTREAAANLKEAIQSAGTFIADEARQHLSEALDDVGRGPHPERSTQVAATSVGHFTNTLLKWLVAGSAVVIFDGAVGSSIVGGAAIAHGTAAIDYASTFVVANADSFRVLLGTFGAEVGWMQQIADAFRYISSVVTDGAGKAFRTGAED